MNPKSWPYRVYKHYFYEHLHEYPGATRILDSLAMLSEIGEKKVNPSQETNIAEREWDNLVILDACRYDVFSNVVDDADYIYSVGSHSREFIRKTFQKDRFEDVVYITGNPHFEDRRFKNLTDKQLDEVFYEVYKTFETDWDDDHRCMMPKPIKRDSISANKLFPDRRKIIHFMQPHNPFIGAYLDKDIDLDSVEDKRYNDLYDMAEKNDIKKEEVMKLYEANLNYVMNFVEELVNELDGKTVITADHADLLGEMGIYGHPPKMRHENLKKVPWMEIE